jgi:anti-sigma factor RsiW
MTGGRDDNGRMTAHDEFETAVTAYALDALEGEERRAFEAHLAGCARCQTELVELRRVAAGLGLAVEPVEPPATLRARTLAQATAESQRASRPPEAFVPRVRGGRRASDLERPAYDRTPTRTATAMWWLTAAAAIVAVATGAYAWSLRVELEALRGGLADSVARADTLAQALSAVRSDSVRLTRTVNVLSAPDLVSVNLQGTAGATAATGRAFWSRSQGLIFTADRLPALGAGRVYQLWVIAGGAPVNAGIFTLDPSGVGSLTVTLPANVPTPSAVAVTAEPGPTGSPAPTTPILLMGETKQSDPRPLS